MLLYSHIQLHVYKYTRKQNQLIMTTSIKERIHFFIKNINLSHFIFVRVMFVVCQKWVVTRTDCYINPSSSSTIALLIPHLSWLLNRGSLRAALPSVCKPVLTLASCLQLTQTVRAPGYIIFYRPPASAILPLLYTGASLDWQLGQGSIYNNVCFKPYVTYIKNDISPSNVWIGRFHLYQCKVLILFNNKWQ